MDKQIFGRASEIKTLERLLSSPKPEFLAVYGRRRVGKTYLIHEFFKDKGVYWSITGSAGSNKKGQIAKFFRELQNKFPDLCPSTPPKDWEEALYSLKEIVAQIDPSKKVVLFFDELPWLASNRSGFLPALEYMWNQHFSHMNNLLLIVCGSAASWIIKKIVNNKQGLYGRLSAVIKLQPFSLDETEKFLLSQNVRLSRKQIVELYMSLGGIAKYLTGVFPGESTAQTINRLCFTAQGQLVLEFANLYRSLFDNSEQHMAIVKELSKKKHGMYKADLLQKTQMSSGGQASLVLEELEESGFIASYPEFQKKAKDKKLWLIDEYSYFYLCWMEQIKGSIALGNDDSYWLKMQSQPRWKTWSGYAFEGICFKHIAQIKKALGISAVLTEESQWSYKPLQEGEKGAEIDLVIDRGDDCIHLCEIKFHRSSFVIDKAYAQELDNKMRVFQERTKTKKTLILTFITPYGVQKNEYFTEYVHKELTLEDFFN